MGEQQVVRSDSVGARSEGGGSTAGPGDGASARSRRDALRGLDFDAGARMLEPVQRREGDGPADDAPAARARPRTFAHWLQAGLNHADQRVPFLGRPLVVDGVVGGQTQRGVRGLQGAVPALIPGAKPLAVDGVVGPATVGALERVVDAPNPFGRRATDPIAQAPPARDDAKADGGERSDPRADRGATSSASPDVAAAPASEVTVDEVPDGVVEAELREEIGRVAVPARARGVDPDVSQAYAEAKRWTMERLDDRDARAHSVHARLTAQWEAAREKFEAWVTSGRPQQRRPPRDPGAMEVFIQARWFKAYWYLKCYQFAAKVQSLLSGRHPSLMALVGAAKRSAEAGEDGGKVSGRTALHRGATLAELAARELANPQLAPGTSIHVKLSFELDSPYDPVENFHHWVVYAGDGKFSDSLTGQNKSGDAHDRTLRAWVKSAFKNAAYRGLHDDPRFVAETRRGAPVPVAGLQPRVTAEYDPRQAVTRRTG